MELAVGLLIGALIGGLAIWVLGRWRRDERSEGEGGFYAADSRRRDEHHHHDNDGDADGNGGDGD